MAVLWGSPGGAPGVKNKQIREPEHEILVTLYLRGDPKQKFQLYLMVVAGLIGIF